MVKNNPRALLEKIIPRRFSRLLLAAAVFHVVLVLTISLIGRTRIAPQTFDESGIGISFAVDSAAYRYETEKMARIIQEGRFRDWWNHVPRYRAVSHLRPYSITFALLGRFFGYGILAAEPVNLFYYLSILTLTFAIGATVFDRNVGRYAAAAVGLWPSLLLYTTQMLRDPLAIAATLLLVFGLTLCIKRALSITQAGVVAAIACSALFILWLGRADSWELVWLLLLLGAVFCGLSQLKNRRLGTGKILATLAILMFAFWLPRALPAFRITELAEQDAQIRSVAAGSTVAIVQEKASQSSAPWEKLFRDLGYLRHRFIERYPDAGSNVDAGVELRNPGDVLRYLPRAVEIGFLAPFPNMWLARGAQVGNSGRLLVGAEMLALYLIIVLVVITLIHLWDSLMVWFLFAAVTSGCVALAYVVINISSLYRMRYPFFILLIILGMKGWFIARERLSGKQPTEQHGERLSGEIRCHRLKQSYL